LAWSENEPTLPEKPADVEPYEPCNQLCTAFDKLKNMSVDAHVMCYHLNCTLTFVD